MSARPGWKAVAAALWLGTALPGLAQTGLTARGWEAAPLGQLQQAAEAGTAAAQYALGLRLQEGNGVLQDYLQAIDWFTRAATQGHAPAQARLGQYYHAGVGVAQDWEAALHWLEQAAASGTPQYLFDLAQILESGPEGDPARAADLYQRAADQGHVEAAANLGVLYQNGIGVAQDLARALSLYEGPAAEGHARALNNLGLIYVRGEGVAQDYGRAAALFQAAAEQGLAVALGNLGTMYENGFGVPVDEALAADLYRRAANDPAQAAAQGLRPGSVFDARLTPPQADPESLARLQAGAAAGDPLAAFLLGWQLLQEPQLDQGRRRLAAQLMTQAAASGYPAAMANLGLIYVEGRALPQDYVLGYMWLVLANTGGHPEAGALSAELATRMTPAQIVEAQARARQQVAARP